MVPTNISGTHVVVKSNFTLIQIRACKLHHLEDLLDVIGFLASGVVKYLMLKLTIFNAPQTCKTVCFVISTGECTH